MTRPLRVGDRVTLYATVRTIGVANAYVDLENGATNCLVSPSVLTLIAPAEPPGGSVVVKDGVAWVRYWRQIDEEPFPYDWASPGESRNRRWDDLCDGEIIFIPGGDA